MSVVFVEICPVFHMFTSRNAERLVRPWKQAVLKGKSIHWKQGLLTHGAVSEKVVLESLKSKMWLLRLMFKLPLGQFKIVQGK